MTGSERPRISLAGAKKIASGNDSDVYRKGDRVYKDYRRLTFDQVARYVELMNKGVSVVGSFKHETPIRIGRTEYAVATEGVGVDQLGVGPAGRPMSVSEYVPEPNLDRLLQPSRVLRSGLQERLGYDAGALSFLLRLNDVLRTENPTRVQDQFHYCLAVLDRSLDRALHVSGLFIGKYNAKLRVSPRKKHILLVITDLALYIDRVAY